MMFLSSCTTLRELPTQTEKKTEDIGNLNQKKITALVDGKEYPVSVASNGYSKIDVLTEEQREKLYTANDAIFQAMKEQLGMESKDHEGYVYDKDRTEISCVVGIRYDDVIEKYQFNLEGGRWEKGIQLSKKIDNINTIQTQRCYPVTVAQMFDNTGAYIADLKVTMPEPAYLAGYKQYSPVAPPFAARGLWVYTAPDTIICPTQCYGMVLLRMKWRAENVVKSTAPACSSTTPQDPYIAVSNNAGPVPCADYYRDWTVTYFVQPQFLLPKFEVHCGGSLHLKFCVNNGIPRGAQAFTINRLNPAIPVCSDPVTSFTPGSSTFWCHTISCGTLQSCYNPSIPLHSIFETVMQWKCPEDPSPNAQVFLIRGIDGDPEMFGPTKWANP